jgi:outer membrane autotransporter protein
MRAKILLSTTLLVSSSALFSPAWADPCPTQANGSYRILNTNVASSCEISATDPLLIAGEYAITVSHARTVNLATDLVIKLDTAGKPWSTAAISAGNFALSPGADRPSILGADKNVSIEILNSESERIGLYASHDSLIQLGNVDIKMENLHVAPGGSTSHYGVVSGSSTSSGDTLGGYDSVTTQILLNNLTLHMTAMEAEEGGAQLTGLRAIKGANPAGRGSMGNITVSEKLNLNIEGDRHKVIGLDVTGAGSTIDLKDSEITLTSTNSESAGIRLGKAKSAGNGWGPGILNSTGDMILNAVGMTAGPAVRVDWQGAALNANGADASTTILAGDVGIRVEGMTEDATDETILAFRNLTMATTSETANLIEIAADQSLVTFTAEGDQNLLQASTGGYLIDVAANSNLDVTVEGGQILGLTRIDPTATLDLDFSNETVWQLAAKTGDDPSTTASFSTLNLTGNSALFAYAPDGGSSTFTLRGDITSTDSAIHLQNGSLGDTLIIQGNYHGAGNAVISLDISLDEGGASDQIIVDGGQITGHTWIAVDEEAAPVTSPRAGLKVVDAINGATIEDDALELLTTSGATRNGKPVIIKGAYIYSLQKGGLGDEDDSETEHDWYLRSLGANGDVVYQEGAPIYEAYPQVFMAISSMKSLQQRYAGRSWLGVGQGAMPEPVADYFPPVAPGPYPVRSGFWVQFDGSYLSHDPHKTTTSLDYNASLYKLQAGVDAPLYAIDGGTLLGSVNFIYANANTTVKSDHGKGHIYTDGYGFGLAATWLDNSGLYVDGQAQFTWYSTDLKSDTLGHYLVRGNDGFGYALSAEAGVRLDPLATFSFTPQAQLTYTSIGFSSFTDPMGARVKLDSGESLRGRLGLSVDRLASWQNAKGLTDTSYVYGIANVYYEFLDGLDVDLAGTAMATRHDDVWGGLGIGGSYSADNNRWTISGDFSVNTALAHFGDSYNLTGTVGVRIAW